MKKYLEYVGIVLCVLSVSGLAKTSDYHERHSTESSNTAATVNINTASASDLMQIKGIGAKKAQAILDYRSTHGNFKSVDELAEVKGMGSKMLERIERENPGKLKVDS